MILGFLIQEDQKEMNRWLDRVWYHWTTWWNPGGDLVTWIGPNLDGGDSDKLLRCHGLVRREDSLIFENTLSCRECSEYDAQNSPGKRGVIYKGCFIGTGLLGEEYDGYGRVSFRK